jgi:NitT/TauT family transport system ATP-binding protein
MSRAIGAETPVRRAADLDGSALLVAESVAKTYETGGRLHAVVGDVSFALRAGEFISIVGPSGCGKTTLLNILCGVVPLTAGRVTWRGQPLSGMPKRVGYMLQKDLLLPWRTALANVTLGLELKDLPRAGRESRARAMLRTVGLSDFHGYYPSALSGGMRQRVALARTLVTDPEVILLDEPFASLDFQTKLLLESDMARLVRSEGRAVLMITHDIEEAVSLSDRVLVLSHQPSRILAVHDIELDTEPGDMMAARQSTHFIDYVRTIWSQLEVRSGNL